MGGDNRYDLFISHSRRLDAEIATALQRGVEDFAKPWWRPRSVRVFRDSGSLSANPDLWSSIEAALSRTRYFLLLASPESAASPWVRRELDWWLAHRSTDQILIAVTAGDVPWLNPSGTPADRADAVPDALLARYAHPPRCVDLRVLRSKPQISRQNPVLLDGIADIGAAVRGVDKDSLVGAHISQHRRAMRTAWSAAALLTVLTVLATMAAVVVVIQRNAARRQTVIATSKQFAATAQADSATDLGRAMLVAAKAYRLRPAPDTLAAAFGTAQASPALVRLLQVGAAVTSISPSADGAHVVSGSADGRVAEWSVTDGHRTVVATLPASVSGVAVSRDGTQVVATDGSRVQLWSPGAQRPLPAPPAATVTSVSISADGGLVGYTSATGDVPEIDSVSIVDIASGARRTVVTPEPVDHLVLGTGTAVAFGGGSGYWARLSLSTLATQAHGSTGFGGHDYASAIDSLGSSYTYTNSARTIPVWRTAGRPDIDHPPLAGNGPGVVPQALALSPGGGRLAVADSGTVYVSATAKGKSADAPYLARLTGTSGAPTSAVEFLGDADHLVSSTGSQLAIWDLNQLSRIAVRQPALVPVACVACPGVTAVPSPDGRRIAYVSSAFNSVVVHDLGSGTDRSYGDLNAFSSDYGPPVWTADGRTLLVPRAATGSVDVVDAGTLRLLRRWTGGVRATTVVDARWVAAGQLAVVDNLGVVTLWDPAGAVSQRFSAPDLGGAELAYSGQAAVNGAGTQASFVTGTSVLVLDLRTRRVTVLVRTNDSNQATGVSYAGAHLLVSFTTAVRVYDSDRLALTRTLTSSGLLATARGSDASDLMAYQLDSGEVDVVDVGSATLVGAIALPASVEGLKTGLAFGSDGQSLFALTEGSDNPGQLERWSFEPDVVLASLCAAPGRTLTLAEWRVLAGSRSPDLSCP